MQGTTVAPASPLPVSNGLAMTLTGLTSATIDMARASVRTDSPVTLDVTGDGQAVLRLTGRWAKTVTVERDGQVLAPVSPSGDVLTVAADLTGHHVLRLIPQSSAAVLAARAAATSAATGTLPATGGAASTAVALALVAAGGRGLCPCRRRLWTTRD
jgi:hypothetical protein